MLLLPQKHLQFRGAENNRIVIQSKLFFDDPDPGTSTYGQLTYSYGGLPSGLTVNDAGRIRGRLPEGTYTFTVTATDGGNLSTQQTFTIIIGKPGKPGKPHKPGKRKAGKDGKWKSDGKVMEKMEKPKS